MLSPSELNGWLMAAFPNQPGWNVTQHEAIHSFQQQMDQVTLTWPDRAESSTVFVRVYRSWLSWWTLITPDLPQREYAAWSVAQRGGVPVAPFLYHGSLNATPGAVIGHVPGATGWLPQSIALAEALADLLARLHTAPMHAADRAHLPDCTLAALLPRLAAWASEAGADQLLHNLHAIERQLARGVEHPATLVHGDCNPNNILVQDDAVTALIDWEEAAFGDPRIDLCWVDAAIRRHNAHLADHFLRAYEERVGYRASDLQLWGDFLEVRYLIVHAWIKHALATGRALPSANPEAWPD